MSEFVHNGKTWPEEGSRWKLQGHPGITFEVRAYRDGLVALFDVARNDNASEVYVLWQDPEQREQWEPADA